MDFDFHEISIFTLSKFFIVEYSVKPFRYPKHAKWERNY